MSKNRERLSSCLKPLYRGKFIALVEQVYFLS